MYAIIVSSFAATTFIFPSSHTTTATFMAFCADSRCRIKKIPLKRIAARDLYNILISKIWTGYLSLTIFFFCIPFESGLTLALVDISLPQISRRFAKKTAISFTVVKYLIPIVPLDAYACVRKKLVRAKSVK